MSDYDSEVVNELEQFDEEFAAAEVEERNAPVPDGKYSVVVEKVEITRTKNYNNLMVKWTLRVLMPIEYEGRLLWRNSIIVSAENLKWLKTDLHTCGLELEKLSDLPAHLEYLEGVKLEITQKSKDKYTNIYFNERIELEEG